jgi:hypothetical protein
VHVIKAYGWSGGITPFIANIEVHEQRLVGLRTGLDSAENSLLLSTGPSGVEPCVLV